MQADNMQFGGSAIKVGEEEFHLFRDYEYASQTKKLDPSTVLTSNRLLAKINE